MFLMLYALPNTILSFAIIYIINNALAGKEVFLKDYVGLVFIAILVYTYLLNIVFQKQLNRYSFKLLYDNEKKLFEQMLQIPLNVLEKLGTQRFYTAVEDLRTFSFLPYTVTHTVNSLLMLVLCLIYMFTLSVFGALTVIGLIVLVAGCYFVIMNSMSKQVETLRNYNDGYYKYVNDVMNGFKELQLSFFRRENLMNRFLVPNRNSAGELDFKISYVFLSINLISQYGLYFVIAMILFVMPEFGILERDDVIAYVVIILFISGPINNLINLQQMYTRFIVANKRIKAFIRDYNVKSEVRKPTKTASEFNSVAFNNVSFTYENAKGEKDFCLGPINLNVKQGEVVFIVGGNGSGKSTFINILTGLYTPSEGEIILNNEAYDGKEEKLQNLIAAVFTNNHIFSHNYEDYTLEGNEKYKDLLRLMELDKIVNDDKDESVRRNFSKGQSKRISLIFALLEDKPILVLDEWAADQDPNFRKFFYEELIPKFKKEGKTIIAVTHDDAYFDKADRILKFDYGQITKDISAKEKKEFSESLWL
ncbi:putative ATP-binding cassette transporter [Aquimarina sp. MAR_2010_214]|nr:putative ATP-binding cassette transporter [Aquimarina sp. MAR_2010_214]